MKHILALLHVLLLLVASTGSAEVFTHITAENGVVEYDLAKDQGNGWYLESTGAYRYKLGFKQGDFPQAERVGRQTITLPLFPAMHPADVERVCDSLGDVLKSNL